MIVDIACNNVRSLTNDISFGLFYQPLVIQTLNIYFDDKIVETTDTYCSYDGYSEKSLTRYEIKSRRCSYINNLILLLYQFIKIKI
jgi:hypothetical protein